MVDEIKSEKVQKNEEKSWRFREVTEWCDKKLVSYINFNVY